jgi:hypothetical protein
MLRWSAFREPSQERQPVEAVARIRTAAEIPVDVGIIETVSPPAYLRIAMNVKHLHNLRMSEKAIARAVGVSDETVTKAARVRNAAMALNSRGLPEVRHRNSAP